MQKYRVVVLISQPILLFHLIITMDAGFKNIAGNSYNVLITGMSDTMDIAYNSVS